MDEWSLRIEADIEPCTLDQVEDFADAIQPVHGGVCACRWWADDRGLGVLDALGTFDAESALDATIQAFRWWESALAATGIRATLITSVLTVHRSRRHLLEIRFPMSPPSGSPDEESRFVEDG